MSKKNILFIQGTGDDGNVQILTVNKDGSADLRHTGSANIYEYIQSDLFDRTFLLLDTNPKQETKVIRFDAVFNQISDPDSHKIALMKAEGMQAKLPKNIPFFNTPENIRKTTRDNIYQLLQGIDKLHVPKTVRIQPRSPSDIYSAIDKEDFEFPVIFRQAGDHGGISTIRVDDKKEQFYTFPLDGRDYYLTQFVEYVDEDGIYAKYRLIVVDGEVFMRHAIFGKEWMVHARNLLEDEGNIIYKQPIAKHFLTEVKPLIQSTITEINHYLGLDYFGIDCHIDKKMNLLVFEVNANMRVLDESRKHVFSPQINPIRQALIKMLSTKGALICESA